MTRPTKILRKKYNTDYADKSVFAANARLLQSIWREENNIPLKRKGKVKKSPILFGTSIAFIGLVFGIIFSQFFLSCIF